MFLSNYVKHQVVYIYFKLTGSLNKANITLHKNTLWDIMEIDW